jgi:hypothetical protein
MMVYELRTYQLKVGALPKYLEIAKTRLLPILAEYGLKPVGFWYTEIGTLNELVHLWAYTDLNDRGQRWAQWVKDPRRAEILGELSQLILTQSNKILTPTEFSGLK